MWPCAAVIFSILQNDMLNLRYVEFLSREILLIFVGEGMQHSQVVFRLSFSLVKNFHQSILVLSLSEGLSCIQFMWNYLDALETW